MNSATLEVKYSPVVSEANHCVHVYISVLYLHLEVE